MLEFSWPAFAFAIVNFLVLVGLLSKFLHKPLLDVLEKRRQGIVDAENEAAQKAKKAEETRQDYEQKLDDIQQERDRVLSEARQKTEEAREEVLQEAREEAEREIRNRKAAFERECREALNDLQDDIVTITVDSAETILSRASDADLNTKLNQRLLEKLREALAQRDGETAITLPSQDDPNLKVTSAAPLDDDMRQRFTQTLEEAGVDPDQVDWDTDEALVAGSRVEFSDRALDGSLQDVLEGLRKRVQSMVQGEEKEADEQHEGSAPETTAADKEEATDSQEKNHASSGEQEKAAAERSNTDVDDEKDEEANE